jgi:hypothetical protein
VKGKAIPLQALTGPEGSRRLRLPDLKTTGARRWQGCHPYAPAAFTSRKYSWYSFLLEAESTPGPKGLCQWKIKMTPSGIDLPVCSAVPQPLRHRVPHSKRRRAKLESLFLDDQYVTPLIVVSLIVHNTLKPSGYRMYHRMFVIYFLCICSPARAMASSSTRFLGHTQRRATVGRASVDEWYHRM